MSQFNVFYRAFCDYRKQTLENGECIDNRKILRNSNVDLEKLEAIRYLYTIETDWIKAIEDGLVYVDKCIREDRQFIRTQGDVVPIEKAKKVSRASVAHLAKHSNLITHVPDEEEIVPDNIYIVEKLSDYSVYENRFIYMLLCYLRDFIELRLKKIVEIANTYHGKMAMSKTIKNKLRDLDFKVELNETRKDNPYPLDNPNEGEKFKRIQEIANIVSILLQTPLMQEVGKSPMIKPPVVKTNVLRMNTNFKNSLELYEFVSNYQGEGFSVEEIKRKIDPFSDSVGDELVEIITLSSFLTFEYGNDLKNVFKEEYNKEEAKKREEENQKLVAQIKALKRRIADEGISPDEYMLLLEKRNRILENEHSLLLEATKLIEELYIAKKKLEEENEKLKAEVIKLKDIIVQKEEEIEALKKKYIEDMAKKEEEHRRIVEELNIKFKATLLETNNKHQSEMVELCTNHKNEIEGINIEHKNEIDNINSSFNEMYNEKSNEFEKAISLKIEEYESKINENNLQFENQRNDITIDFNNKISNLNDVIEQNNKLIVGLNEKLEIERKEHNEKVKEFEDLIIKDNNIAQERIDKAVDEKYLAIAQLHGLRQMHNLITPEEDFTSQERFEELEKEYDAFKMLFKNKWKDTKKRIREELFSVKPVKVKKEKKVKKDIIENKEEKKEIE